MPDHYPQPHCNSYYAATANVTTDYPQLRGASSCDVCIIGAGFTGISAALHLAERGYKVSVLESNRVSWGASGRNGGQLIGGISGEERLKKFVGKDDSELLWKMRWAGHEIIKQRVDKYAIDCDLKFGYMDVAIKARHWRALEEEYESLQRPDFPYETRLVSKQEITNVIGTEAYIGRLDNNIFYSQGYSGHGVNVTHLAGQVVADAIAGTYERFDVFEKVKHYRIPGGQWVGNQLLALGMIYFRLLDLL